MWVVPKKGSPYLEARWHHPDGSGRVVARSTREKTRRAAEQKGREFEAAHRAEWERSQRGGTVSAQHVIEEYWQTELSKKKWAASAEVHLERILTFLGPDRPYCDVTISDVARFVDELVAEPAISDSTINRILAVWRRMHKVAGDVREYPVQRITFSRLFRDEPEGRTRHLKPEEIKALLAALPRHLQEVVVFALLTGARRNQIATLEWDRVDLEHGTATVFKKHRKKDVPHVIQLHPGAVEILRRRYVYGAPDIYPEPHERCLDTTNFQHGFEKAVKAAGLKDLRFHDLRHTAATALARKANLNVVRDQLGHADLRVTLRYAHVQKEDVRAAIAAMPAIEIEGGNGQAEQD